MAYVQLGDICNVVKGEIGITKAIPGDYPMVTTSEFRKSHNKFQLDTKAILVPLVSATGHGHASIKRVHYQEGKFAFGSILAACVPKDENYSAKFLYIYFNLMKDYVLVPLMKGSANVSLTLGNLKKAKVPNISLETQLEIVELYSKIKIEKDKTTDLFSKQEKDIDSLRQAVLQEAVQGKLTANWRANNPNSENANQLLKRIKAERSKLISEKKLKKTREKGDILEGEFNLDLPNSWTIAKAVDLGFITKLAGFEYSKHINLQDEGEVPVIRAQNVKPNRIDETKLKYIDLETSKLLNRCELVKESLLITFIGAGIGEVAVFRKKERWHLAPNVAKLEPFNEFNHNIEIDYLLFYLLSPIGRKELFKHMKSTAQPSLSMGTIRDIIVCLPPIEEQKAIVEKVNALMGLCDGLEQEVQQSQVHSEQLMQSVLREVFEGKRKAVEV
ncbi:restriction endonuclease subunit S [Maribacter stanieri]|uniref:restriction endonuclease subunit S n=1 Tax=Maribacter stanieri TaxID=440514 RepID=UPI00249537C3|nr:restriction endonuclease subunit S [Maribacter stanieri]